MKIGEIVEKSGLTERMLRHYESIGIIVPRKSAKGTRLYSEADLSVARLIHRMRLMDIGLDNLAKIAQERQKHKTGDSSASSVGDLLNALAELLSEKAQQALVLRSEIVEASKAVQKCQGCTNVPSSESCPECPMNDMVERNPVAALVWK
ncbi:MerR family transcriptional regulator [Hoeflea sp.]|uniref:MerR family transcriptional regulator n=1 Tax=Hoeflea sp. TaxID=1940281 RepID=UPI003B0126B1